MRVSVFYFYGQELLVVASQSFVTLMLNKDLESWFREIFFNFPAGSLIVTIFKFQSKQELKQEVSYCKNLSVMFTFETQIWKYQGNGRRSSGHPAGNLLYFIIQ